MYSQTRNILLHLHLGYILSQHGKELLQLQVIASPEGDCARLCGAAAPHSQKFHAAGHNYISIDATTCMQPRIIIHYILDKIANLRTCSSEMHLNARHDLIQLADYSQNAALSCNRLGGQRDMLQKFRHEDRPPLKGRWTDPKSKNTERTVFSPKNLTLMEAFW